MRGALLSVLMLGGLIAAPSRAEGSPWPVAQAPAAHAVAQPPVLPGSTYPPLAPTATPIRPTATPTPVPTVAPPRAAPVVATPSQPRPTVAVPRPAQPAPAQTAPRAGGIPIEVVQFGLAASAAMLGGGLYGLVRSRRR